MRTLLALLFILMASAAEEAPLTSEQKLAVLTFTSVQAIDVAALAKGADPDDPGVEVSLAVDPVRRVAKERLAAVTGVIAAAENYRFDGTALCFEPGLQIRVHEPQRTITLSVCLKCSKMAVSTAVGKPFMIDFSPMGEQAYKALKDEFMVLKQGLEGQ